METKDKFNNKILSVEDIELQEDSSVLIVGKRREGKTILALNLIKFMTEKFNYYSIFLFSDTYEIENNQAFSFIDKQCCFHSKFIDEKIQKIIEYQKQQKQKGKCQNILIVLDDINLEKESKQLNRLYQIARHLKIAVITIVQFAKHVVSNIIKSNTDILIFSKQNNTGLEAIFECINTQLHKQQFYQFVRDNTKNHQFIILITNCQSKIIRSDDSLETSSQPH